MNRRLLLVAVLGLLTSACVPYGASGYYRSEIYTADRYGYPGYYQPVYPNNSGFYVVRQPRYYSPPPSYYRPSAHYYRPAPHDYRPVPGHYDHPVAGHGSNRYRQGSWGHDRNGDGRPDRNWHR